MRRAPLPKFGVDLDGCVYSWSHAARTVLQMRGHEVSVHNCAHWNQVQELVPRSEWEWLWTDGVRQVFANMPAYHGAVEALHELQGWFDLAVLTHRPTEVADLTLRRLADDGIRPYAVVHCMGEEKSGVLPGCVGYVEDREENVYELACAAEVPVFMPRRPYNQRYHDALEGASLGIVPFDDWEEVLAWARRRQG